MLGEAVPSTSSLGAYSPWGAGLTALWVPVVPPLAERGNTSRVMPRFGVLAARLIHSLTTHAVPQASETLAHRIHLRRLDSTSGERVGFTGLSAQPVGRRSGKGEYHARN